MTTTDHKGYAGWSSRGSAPFISGIQDNRIRKAPARGLALPDHGCADPFTILILPAALGLVGVLGAVLCSLTHWN
jgi:hypothetical protein